MYELFQLQEEVCDTIQLWLCISLMWWTFYSTSAQFKVFKRLFLHSSLQRVTISLDCIYFRHQFFEEGLNVLWTLRQSSCTFLASRRGCFHGRKRKAFFWFDEIPGAIDRGTGFSLGNSFRWNLKCVMRRKWKGIEQNIQSLIRILLDQKDSQDIVVKTCCETSKKLC